jgi:hypothetical protein
MIYRLLRPDPAWKAIRFAVPAAVALTIVCSGVPIMAGRWMFFQIFLALLVVSGMPAQRMGPFEGMLPIAGKQIVTARVLALLALLWASCAGAAATFLALGSANAPLAWAALNSAALYSIGIVLLQTSGEEYAAPASRLVPCLVGPIALSLLLPLLPIQPAIVLAVCLVAGSSLSVRFLRSLPSTFQMPAGDSLPAFSIPFPTFAWRVALPWKEVFAIPAAFLVGYSSRWSLAPFCVLAVPAIVRSSLWLQVLPISRRALLWMALLPAMAAYLAGACAGYRSVPPDWSHPAEPHSTNWVPWDFYRTVPEGLPIVAPWGETAAPPAMQVRAIVYVSKNILQPLLVGARKQPAVLRLAIPPRHAGGLWPGDSASGNRGRAAGRPAPFDAPAAHADPHYRIRRRAVVDHRAAE